MHTQNKLTLEFEVYSCQYFFPHQVVVKINLCKYLAIYQHTLMLTLRHLTSHLKTQQSIGKN